MVSKRNLIGAIALFLTNTLFYGKEIYFTVSSNQSNQLELFISIIGIVISTCILFMILFGKDRQIEEKVDKKTDWFFNNKEYDRKHDNRADENQYKF